MITTKIATTKTQLKNKNDHHKDCYDENIAVRNKNDHHKDCGYDENTAEEQK